MEELPSKRVIGIGESIVIALAFVILSLLLRSVYPFLLNIFGFGLSMLIFYLITMGSTFLFALKLRNEAWRAAVFTIPPFSLLLASILTTVGLLWGALYPIADFIPISESIKQQFIFIFESPSVFSFLALVIAAPILEELIFRGVILEGLLKKYSPLQAIVISSLLFGLIHLNPSQFVSAFLGGLFIGWVYAINRNLILCILIHFTINLIAFCLFSTMDLEWAYEAPLIELYGGTMSFIAIIGIGLLLLLGGIRFMDRNRLS